MATGHSARTRRRRTGPRTKRLGTSSSPQSHELRTTLHGQPSSARVGAAPPALGPHRERRRSARIGSGAPPSPPKTSKGRQSGGGPVSAAEEAKSQTPVTHTRWGG